MWTENGREPHQNGNSVVTKAIYAIGEMANRIRQYAWEQTPLGPIDHWPDILVWSVNLILDSRFPTTILWG